MPNVTVQTTSETVLCMIPLCKCPSCRVAGPDLLCCCTHCGKSCKSSEQILTLRTCTMLQEMVLFLQKLPTTEWDEKDIEMVLSRAYMLRASFNDARSHLQS